MDHRVISASLKAYHHYVSWRSTIETDSHFCNESEEIRNHFTLHSDEGDYQSYPNNYTVKSRILSHAHSCGPACKNKYLKMNVYEQDVILTVLGVFARLEQLPISH